MTAVRTFQITAFIRSIPSSFRSDSDEITQRYYNILVNYRVMLSLYQLGAKAYEYMPSSNVCTALPAWVLTLRSCEVFIYLSSRLRVSLLHN